MAHIQRLIGSQRILDIILKNIFKKLLPNILTWCIIYLEVKRKEKNKIKQSFQSKGEIKMKNCVFHHSALTRGYVSVKCEGGIVEKYEGKFGKGYTVKRHNPDSTRYCIVEYYVA